MSKKHYYQGRIQDFSQVGARYKIYVHTARSAVPVFWGFAPPRASFAPPINIIMVNTLGKTYIKKWSDEWSEQLRKNSFFL